MSFFASRKLKLQQWWPVALITLVNCALFVVHYQPNTYFLGWDNTAPELNLPLNFERFLFGPWQEYRGLGTEDGMAHSANLVHLLYSALLSILVPVGQVRLVLNILLHYAGMAGMFVLTRKIIKTTAIGSLIAALFYGLNPFTIQLYYVPLELFSFHFALIPWGLWSLWRYLQQPSWNKASVIFIVHIAFLSQAHVPTLFVTYSLAIGLLLLAWLISTQGRQLGRVFAAGLLFLIPQLFWLLPYTHAVIAKTDVLAQTTQNRIGTPSVVFRNRAWGDLHGLATFGTFRLDYKDWDTPTQTFVPILDQWREWRSHPAYLLSAYALSLVGLSSIGASLFLNHRRNTPIVLTTTTLLGVSILMLGSAIPGLSQVSNWLGQNIPLFGQIFRFAFTKFGMLYVAALSLSLALGSTVIRNYLDRRWTAVLQGGVLVAIVLVSWPIWRGNFFYSQLFVDLPSDYHQVATKLNQQPKTRYALVPMHTLWGWISNSSSWGYRGSGFAWQMTQAPLIDRSFDAWSLENETAYLQLSQALYEQNYTKLEQLLAKFHITHLLHDTSLFNPGGYAQALQEEQLKNSLQRTFTIESITEYLTLYKTSAKNLELNHLDQATPVSSEYQTTLTRNDPAFQTLGNYFQSTTTSGVAFPFSFLTKQRFPHQINQVDDFITFNLPHQSKVWRLPNYQQTTKFIPTAFFLDRTSETRAAIKKELQLPTLLQTEATIYEPSNSQTSNFTLPEEGYVSIDSFISPIQIDQEQQLLFVQPQSATQLKTSQIVTIHTWSGEETTDLHSLPNQFYGCDSQRPNDEIRVSASDTSIYSQNGVTCIAYEYAPTLETTSQLTTLEGTITFDQIIDPTQISMCLTSNSSDCVNQALSLKKEAATSYSFETQAVVYQGVSYQLIITLPVTEKELTTTPSNFISRLHTPLSQVELPANNSLERLDQTLVNLQREKRGPSSIKIPLGTQEAFIAYSTDSDLSAPHNCAQNEKGFAQLLYKNEELTFTASQGGIACKVYRFPALSSQLEYVYHLKADSVGGAGLKLYLTNPISKRFEVEEMITGSNQEWNYPVYPTATPLTTQPFELVFNAESYGSENSYSSLKNHYFISLPLSWLTQIHTALPTEQFAQTTLSSQRIHPTLYKASIRVISDPVSSDSLIELPQAYDPAWLAIALDQKVITPTPTLLQQVVVNGWANGWLVPAGDYQVYIFFWPQVLVFVGLGIAGVTCILLVSKSLRVVSTVHPNIVGTPESLVKIQRYTLTRRALTGLSTPHKQKMQRKLKKIRRILAHALGGIWR